MIGKIFKIAFRRTEKKENKTEQLSAKIREKSAKISHLFFQQVEQASREFFSIKSKIKNLEETNYKLGLTHIEKGNLLDAIFRFRFVIKFWPNCYDAYYQLAYCLVMRNRFSEAKAALEELFIKNPSYDHKAQELLDYIIKLESNTDANLR